MDNRSIEEAKRHIEDIRSDYGLKDKLRPKTQSSLHNALVIISEQLNSDSTHFLMEMIQNADDNNYAPGVVPELEFDVRDGILRVDCNEEGFLERNVDAVCQIGASTKSGGAKKQQGGPIGEKGIGFKSVFKVANTVYITSRNYSFKFDKLADHGLGMVAPYWSEPPPSYSRRPGFTSFYLQFSSNSRRQEVKDELGKIDATILSFLNKLRQIKITIDGKTKTLRREDKINASNARFVLHQDNEARNYILIRKLVQNLPVEEKRPGIRESEVKLAFPVDNDGDPFLQSQSVFAFLPLREYGLQYLVQGDFITVANREDVDISSPWNKALRKGIAEATVQAAHHLNGFAKLRSTWFRFMPWKSHVYGFFSCIVNDVFNAVKYENVLENFDGSLAPPGTLFFVPPEFCDEEGVPVTWTRRTGHKYLSKRYDATDKDALLRLGVTEMTIELLIEELESIIRKDRQELPSRSNQWHSTLAQILERGGRSKTNKAKIRKLELIPLRDGRWVSAPKEGCKLKDMVFFPDDTFGLEIPGGLRLHLVTDEAAKDWNRNVFYTSLGVVRVDSVSISKTIEAWHLGEDYAHALSFEQLLSQLIFMFRIGWRGKQSNSTLWVVTEDNKRRRGSDVYVDSNLPSAAITLLDRQRFHFLHKEILNAVADDSKHAWYIWLTEALGISTHPKLVRVTADVGWERFDLHEDFRYIMKHTPSTVTLCLLRDNWHRYSRFIESAERAVKDKEPEISRVKLREQLQALPATCTNGKIYPLSQTFLPLKELERVAHGCVPFVDVPKPDDHRWRSILSCLGVRYEDDIIFYLTCMKALKEVPQPSQSRIRNLLEHIQARSGDDRDQVCDKFEKDKLIYIPTSSPHSGLWVKPSQCVWEGPSILRSVYALHGLYPDSKRLFMSLLGLENVNLQHLIKETFQFRLNDDVSYITDVFLELEKFLTDNTPASDTKALAEHSIFPVTKSAERSRFDSLLGADANHTWWIADTTQLYNSFKGIIPLLAMSIEDVGRLKRLFKAAKVDLRKLSHAVEGVAEISGVVTSWSSETTSLRSKANSILRLVPDTEPHRKKIFEQLRNVEAFKAPDVIQRWQVDHLGSIMTGRKEPGHIALRSDGDSLQLFFANKSIGTPALKWQLIERLYTFCGLDKCKEARREPRYLLTQIISTDSQAEIDELLDQAAVPALATDVEVDEATERLKNEHIRQYSQRTKTAPAKESTWAKLQAFIESQLRENVFIFSRDGAAPVGLFQARSTSGETRRPGTNAAWRQLEGTSALDGRFTLFASSTASLNKIRLGRRPRVDEDLERRGEKTIHEILTTLNQMGLQYDQATHWTSRWNPNKASSSKVIGQEDGLGSASFTFPDKNCVFSTYLATGGCEDALEWSRYEPTYHIDVKSTRGAFDTDFPVSRMEFKRAQRFVTLSVPSGKKVRDIYVIVRVFEMDEAKPKHAWFPDFMTFCVEGHLELDPLDGFEAKIVRNRRG